MKKEIMHCIPQGSTDIRFWHRVSSHTINTRNNRYSSFYAKRKLHSLMPKGLQINAVKQLQIWQILQWSQVCVAQCIMLTQTKDSKMPRDHTFFWRNKGLLPVLTAAQANTANLGGLQNRSFSWSMYQDLIAFATTGQGFCARFSTGFGKTLS